jgi:hypothetical protein
MNLGELRAIVRRRIGNPSAADVPDSVLNGHINDAAEEIQDKYSFVRLRKRARFTTTAGTDKYLISPLTEIIYKVWDRTNKLELVKVGANYVASREFDGLPNAKPRFYARFEDYVQLLGDGGGAPDGAYDIEMLYRAKFATMTDDTHEPEVPEPWHKGISLLAAYNYYDADGKDAAKAQAQWLAWRNWVADKPVEAHEETEAIDSGVELPGLAAGVPLRLPFDLSP